jgi:tRNA A37 methylthiotransferase MiaB
MHDQVPEPEKKRRAEWLRRVGIAKRQAFAEQSIGTPLAVLIEGNKDKSTGLSVGLSDNYIPIACRGTVETNRIVRVLPGSFRNGRLIGEVIHL